MLNLLLNKLKVDLGIFRGFRVIRFYLMKIVYINKLFIFWGLVKNIYKMVLLMNICFFIGIMIVNSLGKIFI